jgi:CRP-like cAMP-binding protein
MVDLDTLRRFPYFAELSDQNLKEIALITEQKTVPAGAQIFAEGDDADFLYVIVRGQVEIQYTVGAEKLLSIQTLNKGDLLVWSSIIEPYKCKALGTAKDETLLLAIDARQLREFFDTDPVLAQLLLHQVSKMLGERLENARHKFVTLYQHLDEILAQSKV